MTKTVTNKWILDLNVARGYLSLVNRDTQKPIVTISRELQYAITRTARKCKDELELLQDELQKGEDLKKKLKKAKEDPNLNGSSLELETELREWETHWDKLQDQAITLDIHACGLEAFPAQCDMPNLIFETLEVLIPEQESEK